MKSVLLFQLLVFSREGLLYWKEGFCYFNELWWDIADVLLGWDIAQW